MFPLHKNNTRTLSAYKEAIARGQKPESKAHELQLIRAAQAGDSSAQATLFYGAAPFVMALAKKHERQGIDPADLIQIGNMEVLRGIAAFDFARGQNYLTGVTHRVAAAMQRFAERKSTVVQRGEAAKNARAVRDAIGYLQREEGMQTAAAEAHIEAEIAAKTKYTFERAAKPWNGLQRNATVRVTITRAKLQDYRLGEGVELSTNYNNPLTQRFIEAALADSPYCEHHSLDEQVDHNDLHANVNAAFETLSPLQQELLDRTLGLFRMPQSRTSAAKDIGITDSAAKGELAAAYAQLRKTLAPLAK